MQFIQIISLCWVSAELLCKTDSRYSSPLYQSPYLLCHCWIVAQCTRCCMLHGYTCATYSLSRFNSESADFTIKKKLMGALRSGCEDEILRKKHLVSARRIANLLCWMSSDHLIYSVHRNPSHPISTALSATCRSIVTWNTSVRAASIQFADISNT